MCLTGPRKTSELDEVRTQDVGNAERVSPLGGRVEVREEPTCVALDLFSSLRLLFGHLEHLLIRVQHWRLFARRLHLQRRHLRGNTGPLVPIDFLSQRLQPLLVFHPLLLSGWFLNLPLGEINIAGGSLLSSTVGEGARSSLGRIYAAPRPYLDNEVPEHAKDPKEVGVFQLPHLLLLP